MPRLVFDIETVGEDFNSLDETSKDVLTRWIKKEANSDEEYKSSLEDLKKNLGFSPLTGEIVAIGVLDSEKEKGAVYFQAPGQDIKPFEEDGIKFKVMTEKEILDNFWKLANNYDQFVSFSGREFDVPFMMVRSAVNGIRPTKDLIANRYLNYQKPNALHIDLQDQLSFYGSVRRKSSLHLWCRAFGIKSPKASGVKGDDVAPLFKERKFLDIARYNVGDIRATKELYDYWDKYIRF